MSILEVQTLSDSMWNLKDIALRQPSREIREEEFSMELASQSDV